LVRRERKGRGGARRDSRLRRQAGDVEEKKKGRGRGRDRRVGPRRQREQRKRKRERRRGPVRGEGWRAAGLFGPKGEKVRFPFFLFFFKLLFKTTFLFKFKSNSFKLFLKNFVNF
jgi:hypothetical protein